MADGLMFSRQCFPCTERNSNSRDSFSYKMSLKKNPRRFTKLRKNPLHTGFLTVRILIPISIKDIYDLTINILRTIEYTWKNDCPILILKKSTRVLVWDFYTAPAFNHN